MRKLSVLLVLLMACLISHRASWSQTYVSGAVSGVWAVADGPYYVTDTCTVAEGETLRIEPGVSIYIGMGLNLDVEGQLIAEGTQSRPITFTSPSSDAHWGSINLTYSADDVISVFRYCEFTLAQTAIRMINGPYSRGVLAPIVEYCSFRDCREAGIYAEAYGVIHATVGNWWYMLPDVDPIINGCTFINTNDGCSFLVRGHRRALAFGMGSAYAYGHASPTITNSVFFNLEGAGIRGEIENYYDAESKPIIANNTFIDCHQGLDLAPAYDATITNNIFTGAETAITRTEDLSGQVLHNCFSDNATNFSGYPDSFGTVVQSNANGTPCDIAFNIFTDPLINDPAGGDFHLSSTSPCINAGTTESAPEDDMDQHLRPWRENEAIDIGADEYNGEEYLSPAVESVSPSDGATDVRLDTQLVIEFSKDMSAATISTETIQLIGANGPVAGSVAYSERQATFTPGTELSPLAVYTATISREVRDIYGIMLVQAFTWSFTTTSRGEPAPLSVVSTAPSDGEVDVAVNTAILVNFSEAVDPASLTADSYYVDIEGNRISGDIFVDDRRVTFQPSELLPMDKTVSVILTPSVSSRVGMSLPNIYQWSFTTGSQMDDRPPVLLSTEPLADETEVSTQALVKVVFDETIDPSTVTYENFSLLVNDQNIPGQVTCNGREVIFTPVEALQNGTTYTAHLDDEICDLAGNPTTETYQWNFTTSFEGDDGAVDNGGSGGGGCFISSIQNH